MQYGTVTGRLLAAVADSVVDADFNPDEVPLSGRVVFTPSATALKVVAAGATILPVPIKCDLDSEGYLTLNGKRGVNLIATDTTDTNPTGFTYKVSFESLTYAGTPVSYGSFSIAVPAGQTVDLAVVAPVAAANGAAIIRGEPGAVPDVTIGDVQTVDAAADADAFITGDETLKMLNLRLPRGPQGAPGGSDAATAGWIDTEAPTATKSALSSFLGGLFQPRTRQFVYFGDSWGTQLYPDTTPLPNLAVARVGGNLVKNYAVAGALVGPTSQNGGNTTDAQVTAAQADASYNKSRITDVVVLAGVNNLGGYLPTVDQARGHFQGIASLYPNARLWFASNGKRAINNAGDNDPWRWYNRLFEGASLAGFAVAEFSPMWTWSAMRSSGGWWDAASTDSSRHPSAAGFAAVATRLAGFLTGESWRPYFKVPTALHANAAALMAAQGVAGTPTLATDDTTIEGSTLRLNVSIGGMDGLAAVPTTAFQPILQLPTAYMPIGNYLMAPAGCRLSSGTMDFTYALRVNAEGAGVVSVDPRLLNNHVGYFVLRADLPLNMVKTAD